MSESSFRRSVEQCRAKAKNCDTCMSRCETSLPEVEAPGMRRTNVPGLTSWIKFKGLNQLLNLWMSWTPMMLHHLALALLMLLHLTLALLLILNPTVLNRLMEMVSNLSPFVMLISFD